MTIEEMRGLDALKTYKELEEAKAEIEEKRKDVVWLATEKAKLENYVTLLEEAGDAMMSEPCEYTFEQWIKAKEAKQ